MKKGKKAGADNKTKNENPPLVMEPEAIYQTSLSSNLSKLPSLSTLLGKKQVSASIDSIINKHQYISFIRQGFTMQTLQHLMQATDISSSEISEILHTSERTLRRYDADTVLSPEQTERILELARLYTRGSEVFNSLENFKEWMSSTVIALGNIKPKELLDTSLGIEILQEELGRIEHGVFA